MRNNPYRYVRLERKVIEEVSDFLFALGNQFVNVNNANGAFDCYKYSVDLNPKNQPSVYNLGALYNLMGNFNGSYLMFKEAMRMNPTDINSITALGEVCRKLGKLEEAKNTLDIAYKLEPGNYAVLSAISVLHYDNGDLQTAMDWNERAAKLEPKDIRMLLNKVLINMTLGKWPEWWSQYEYCLSYQKNERMRGLAMSSAWAGQVAENQTLLIVSDQGSGDAIQFSRYIKEVKELGKFGRIIYLVQPDLKSLMLRVPGVDEVIGFGETMKIDYDQFSSLLGIMRVLNISPENCWRHPHIITDPTLDTIWKYRINAIWDGHSKKVGIVWAGDAKHGNDHSRSLKLEHFLKLINGTDNIQFFSFQVGPPLSELTLSSYEASKKIIDLGSDFRNFDDTASALREMDLLISCDTSVPHLAGCLGITNWVLVACPPEWRMLTDLTHSVWYDQVSLFRQQSPKDWNSVIDEVLIKLKEFGEKQ